jgi:predicted ATPase/signal transduction histidine kinase
MLHLSGYAITETLHTGNTNILYRGVCHNRHCPVILKTLRQDYPSLGEIAQLKQEYQIMAALSAALTLEQNQGLVQVYGLELDQHRPVLVLEDFGGQSLQDWLDQQTWNWQQPASCHQAIGSILTIAITLTRVLEALHQQQVIHKDIKPANIIINPHTGTLKLTDFSIASRLDRETPSITPPQHLEGTLAYMAPEQTGRMNRIVDYRCDFYSLGVTLYQLLTGELPFSGQDTQAIVYAHLTQQPQPISDLNPAIPSVLGAIVAKLMEKNAEDRYQSAAGLLFDLERCLDEWVTGHTISEFIPGKRDRLGQLSIPQKLYGRETEVQRLLAAFDRVTGEADNARSTLLETPKSELILVSGYSGIGKTSLVHEIHKPITKRQGYFLHGKFDQLQHNIPYASVIQAFRKLVQQLLLEADVHLLKTQLQWAVGHEGQVLLEVIPALAQILGLQPDLPPLGAEAAQMRFHRVFVAFVQVFARLRQPLVLFLDDLQWADCASLHLIEVLLAQSHGMLIIGAYRDNEVSPLHPLMKTIEAIAQASQTVEHLVLSPLGPVEVEDWLQDTLREKDASLGQGDRFSSMGELLFHKTQGNPFFLTQLLKTLHSARLIQFDFAQGLWQWDLSRIQAAGVLDKSVVDLVAQQIQHLPDRTQNILKLAACIGAWFNLETLVVSSNLTPFQLAEALQPALQAGLILPLSPEYRVPLLFAEDKLVALNFDQAQIGYRFLHDRVQQAAYNLIPEADRPAIHLKIGRSLRSKIPLQARDSRIFDIVNQLNAGRDCIHDPVERDQLANFNLVAGRKAKAAAAYEPANQYFSIAQGLMNEADWQHQYDLMLTIHLELAESYYLVTQFDQAEQLATTILTQTENLLDCIKVYELQIDLHIAKGQQVQAVEVGCQAVAQLGIPLMRYSRQVADLPQLPAIEDLAKLPEMQQPRLLASLRILSKVAPAAYQAVPQIYPDLVLTAVGLCLSEGHSPLASYIYGAYSAFLQSIVGDPAAAYHAGQIAFYLLEKYPAKELEVKVYMVVSTYASPGKIALRDVLAPLKKGIDSGLETGSFAHASLAAIAYCTQLLLSGEPLDKLQKQQMHYIALLKKLRQLPYLGYANLLAQWVENLQNVENLQEFETLRRCDALERFENYISAPSAPWKIVGQYADEAELIPWFEQTRNYQALFMTHGMKGITAYLFGEPQLAVMWLKQAMQWQSAALGLPLKAAYYFYYSLALLALEPTADDIQQVHSNQAHLQTWASHGPMNYQHQYDLVAAELARLQGQEPLAMDLYDRAIAGAKANAYLPQEALGNELAARFYLAWNKPKVAAGYMQEAYYCYADWGAMAKVIALENQYADLLRPILQSTSSLDPLDALATIAAPKLQPRSSTNSSRSRGTRNTEFDFTALLKAGQSLIGLLNLDDLLQEITKVLLANSGGDRCALMLPNGAGEFGVMTVSTAKGTDLWVEPLYGVEHLPVQLIQYVKQTQEVVVIDDLETDLPILDTYLIQDQPSSLLCLPILNQGQVVAIVYLTNHLTSGAFSSDCILILNFLSVKAAIALENAHLYRQSQLQTQQMLANEQAIQEQVLALVTLSQSQAISHGELIQAFQEITEATAQTLQVERVSIWQFNPTHDQIDCADLFERSLSRHSRGLVLPVASYPNYFAVVNTQAIVAVSDAQNDFITHEFKEGYLKPLGIMAMLDATIQLDGKVSGVICCEQVGTIRAWTQAEQNFVRSIANLIALAIESNRRQQETDKLQQALIELEQTQLQMVQQEKMASLGGLVAGIAHEINNPVNFIHANLDYVNTYTQSLVGLIQTYQQHVPNPPEAVQSEIEAVDLDFLTQDLTKVLKSMQAGTDRIQSIILSLRSFSRLDEADLKFVQLQEDLDNTLLILHHRCEPQGDRPGIQVIKKYGDLPPVECYSGQLNQVFLHLLTNAIDALEEKIKTGMDQTPTLWIGTEMLDNRQVRITIADNGSGIPEAARSRLFDPFFTTKAIGKGTGLGLSISYQTVFEKHHGRLSCRSNPGQGSQFYIDIPVQQSSLGFQTPPIAAANGG